MKTKIHPKYAVEAIILQLRKNIENGEDGVYFRQFAIHPEAGDGCTFGDLIDALPRDVAEQPKGNLFDRLAKLAANLDCIGNDFQAVYSMANRVTGLKLLTLIALARGMARETDELLAALKADSQDPRK